MTANKKNNVIFFKRKQNPSETVNSGWLKCGSTDNESSTPMAKAVESPQAQSSFWLKCGQYEGNDIEAKKAV